jgi:hypothetical protein
MPDETGPDPAGELLGRWRLVRAEAGLDLAPEVRLEFAPHGLLHYEFAVGTRREALTLAWAVEGDTLRTELTGGSHARSTLFHIGPGEVLVLDFVGARAWFIREWQGGDATGRG